MYEMTKIDYNVGEIQSPAPAMLREGHRYTQAKQEKWPMDLASENGRERILVSYLYRRIIEQGWIEDSRYASQSNYVPGLVLRSDSGDGYAFHPPNAFIELSTICSRLDITAAFTMQCESVHHIIQKLHDAQTEITLQPHHLTIPVAQSLRELATSNRSVMRRDYACFVKEESLLLLWSHTADDLLTHARDIEDKLVDSIWGGLITTRSKQIGPNTLGESPRLGPKYRSSIDSFNQVGLDAALNANDSASILAKDEFTGDTPGFDSLKDFDFDTEDIETQKIAPRPFILTQSVIVSIACMLILATTAGGIRAVLIQVKILGHSGYTRLIMLIMIPLSLACCLFFFTIIVNSVFQVVGPIKDIRSGNSRFYSAVKPDPSKHRNIQWPHITIQMPVYKESLKGVIQPTVNSLLPAIAHYERMGGTASIFVADDGMQVVQPQLADIRRNFYNVHGIGWVARPPHGKDGFIRGGRFKKASNLNYALDCTLRVEDELLRLIQERSQELGCTPDDLDVDEESQLYNQALAMVIETDQGRTMAAGNIRMGEIILLIDCDTRVPVDCLGLAAMEMEESPEVAIIQHASGVLKVTDTWFEDCIAYFTEIIYLSIRFAVGNGDAAPFVGHNAFLRWKAMQSVRFTEKDGRELFWSESHVSEDFDMALRLQTGGFVVRLATYDDGEFKEGVSLTIFDELLRWEKYAYGCSELLFNPIYYWLWRGPLTPMVWKILTSNMKVTSKFTIFGYVFTYYAIALSLPLTIVMYFFTGWFGDDYQIVTFEAWKVFIGVLIVFQVVCPLCFAIYRHRLGNIIFWRGYLENLKWSPFFMVFFAGISWHLCYALIAHVLCLPIEWTSTAKELEATGFFISFDRVLKTFKWSMLFAILTAVGLVYIAQFAPPGWIINYPTGILPLATQVAGHLALPLLCLFH